MEFIGEEQRDKIVEYSPTERFIKFNELLGTGNYKKVYRAYDNQTGKELAWVAIELNRIPAPERKRLCEEITILKAVDHPNIVRFLNQWVNKSRNQIILMTEMLNGGSLKRHLQRIKRPRINLIKGWCRSILRGIHYLHSMKPNPIIHRDIKCDNIFINTTSNQIKIGDLGLAVTLKKQFTSSLLGTPQFMAPQIYQGKYSTSVDIYAFGMCVIEMATLKTPYYQCNNIAQILKKIDEGIKPLALQSIQDESLRKFVEKCIDRVPELRPTAGELLQDQLFESLSGRPSEDRKQSKRQQKTERQIKDMRDSKQTKCSKQQTSNSSSSSFEEQPFNLHSKLFRQAYFFYMRNLKSQFKSLEQLKRLQQQERQVLKAIHDEVCCTYVQQLQSQQQQMEQSPGKEEQKTRSRSLPEEGLTHQQSNQVQLFIEY